MNNTEKTRYDKIDSLNAYIKYVLERRDKLKIAHVSLADLIQEATRMAQCSGIKLEDYYVNQTVNGQKTIQQ